MGERKQEWGERRQAAANDGLNDRFCRSAERRDALERAVGGDGQRGRREQKELF